ncbi:hypothetical protein AMATHDRAFT_138947 [Amanita thiersii Skay4041]|uniref:Protein EFR3 n=1 Tax=Amanita thiersii Skay4041 TaxID=703135 RepID=A0A2A9NQM4_9AGAR|nr:hypothetical protein AMATHDRAFT_138947 [Amanita thiersii Skay4041]
MHIFTPNHVQLLNACYPPTASLLAAGSNYSPNSHELSRLTYYASNHPSKLTKLGSELEKRIRVESRKTHAGNVRARALLLVSLAILRALTLECRRDINLFSTSLMSCVDVTLSSVPSDLEILARAASVFLAWTTYTDGHLIGLDGNLTRDYISVLGHFSDLSCCDSPDLETKNRTRLMGLAALTGAANSEALYNSSAQFASQVSAMMRPVLHILLDTDLEQLEEQAINVKDNPTSPYLDEFRTRPTMERRAASIHAHIDGDDGPSLADVSSAVLRVLFALLSHANGSQLGQIIQSAFDNLSPLRGWSKTTHCCWFARKTTEWAQYQYRYVVPTWLVERLQDNQDSLPTDPLLKTILSMVTSVLNSPIPLVDLASSDILSNLVVVMLQRTAKDPLDELLPGIVDCIAALGRHVYYSDQIQDLAVDIINRLTIIELQGLPGSGTHNVVRGRSEAIRGLLAALRGLIYTANKQELVNDRENLPGTSPTLSDDKTMKGADEIHFRRTRVPPDIWHETLSLLCDNDYSVRADYADVLVFYLIDEMPKHGDITSHDGRKRPRKQSERRLYHAVTMNVIIQGDFVTKVITAIHAYLYILSTACTLGIDSSPNSPCAVLPVADNADSADSTKSMVQQSSRLKKLDRVQRLTERVTGIVTSSCCASLADYAHMLHILTTVHEQTPVRGLLTGVPMLLALDASTRQQTKHDSLTALRVSVVREVIARVWLVLGQVWDCSELVDMVQKTLATMPRKDMLPDPIRGEAVSFQISREPTGFVDQILESQWPGIDPEAASKLLSTCRNVQDATGFNADVLLQRLTSKWTVETALKDCESSVYDYSVKGDGVSPLLKISPALMHDNMSLHSLARSIRGVGVTELREALEGRSSMSNPALVNAPSISTIDHTSSIHTELCLSQTRSRSRAKHLPASGSGEVRDVLNRLGIGKQNANLLKASFPALQKPGQKSVFVLYATCCTDLYLRRVPPYKI